MKFTRLTFFINMNTCILILIYNEYMSYELKTKTNNLIAYYVIKNAILNNKVAHAYLFSAPKNVEIHDESLYLIQLILGANVDLKVFPDLYTIDGSKDFIKKEQVIHAINLLQETPLDFNGNKILLIKNIENSNKHSLNSLLKFLEEPTQKTYIIMTTNNILKVLSTIISRSQVINLKAMSISNLNLALQQANIPKGHSRIIASIAKSEKDGINIYQDINYLKTYNNLIGILKASVNNSKIMITSFSQCISKNNYLLMLKLFQTFLNDIWKKQQGIAISFKNIKLIDKYVLINFDYKKALVIINDFIVMQNSNVNFELYKTKLLLTLERCYE